MVHTNTITDILNNWADLGIFAYVLPFLMLFAIVFGILNKSKILGDNRGVQATIALAVGLLSLQFDYVSNFFATIFPYTGIGIAVVLVLLILTGVFVGENDNWARYVWMGVGALVFIVVLIYTFEDYSWLGGYWGNDAWKAMVGAIIIIGLMIAIIFSGGKSKPK